MAGYGTATGWKTLLETMRDKARQDSTILPYLRKVEVCFPPLDQIIINQPALYISWRGSPETRVGGTGAKIVKRAEHLITLYPVIYFASHDDTAAILGDGRHVGIAQFTEDVIDFFGGNLLGLSGLEAEKKPDIEAPAGAHTIIETDDGKWMQLVALNYTAYTRPFERG